MATSLAKRVRGGPSLLLALSVALILCSVQCEQSDAKVVDNNDIEKMEMAELMHINDQLAAEKQWQEEEEEEEEEEHRKQFDYSQNNRNDFVVDGPLGNSEQQLFDLIETERARMRERKIETREVEGEELVENGGELDDEAEQSVNMNRVQRALLRAGKRALPRAGKRALLRAGRSFRFPSSRAERFGNSNHFYPKKLRFFVDDSADINEINENNENNENDENDENENEEDLMERSSLALPRAGKRALLRAGKRGLLRAGKRAALRKAFLLRPGRHVPGWHRSVGGK